MGVFSTPLATEKRKKGMTLTTFIKKYRIQLLICSTTIIHILIASKLLLHPDEAYYWDWTRHLDYGYYDHPPMVAWTIWLFSFLPLSELTVRLPAIFSAIFVSLLGYDMMLRLGVNRHNAWLGLVLITISPWLTLTAFIITPDVFALLFYTLTIYAGVRFALSHKVQWLYLVGILVALSILSKLTSIFLLPVFLSWMLLDSRQRKWLKTIHPWLSAFIGSFGGIILLIWNHNHNNALLYRLNELKLGSVLTFQNSMSEASGFILSNIFMLSPWICFIIILALPRFRTIFSKMSSGWSLILLSALLPWVYAIPTSFYAKFQGNWLVFCSVPVTILAIGIMHYYQISNIEYKNKERWIRYSIYWFGFLLLLVSFLPFIGAAQSRMKEFNGWKELGAIVDKELAEAPNPTNTVIYSRRYQSAALIGFYAKSHPHVNTFSNGVRKSMYDIWTNHKHNAGKDVVFIELKRWNKTMPITFWHAFKSAKHPSVIPIKQENKTIHEVLVNYGFNLEVDKLPSVDSGSF